MSAIIDAPLSVLLQEEKQALILLILGTAFCAFLVPIAILLFFFSDEALRRQPVFLFNLFAIALGIVQQCIYASVIVNSILLRPVPTGLVTSIIVLYFFVPISVQSVLLVRVVTAYPPHLMGSVRRVAIYAPIVLLKLGRVINVCLGVPHMERQIGSSPSALDAVAAVWGSPIIEIEWFLQLFDDVYVSSLFLAKILGSMKFNTKQDDRTRSTRSLRSPFSYAARLKALFWGAVSSFVFPVIFNIVQLVLIFQDRNFFHDAYVITINSYVTIISVVLATIWTSGQRKVSDLIDGLERNNKNRGRSTVRFAGPDEPASGVLRRPPARDNLSFSFGYGLTSMSDDTEEPSSLGLAEERKAQEVARDDSVGFSIASLEEAGTNLEEERDAQ